MSDGASVRSRFLIDETVVESRLARVVDGRLVALTLYAHIAPAALRAQFGDIYLARVTKSARGMNGVFVDLGAAGEGLLRTHDAFPEGSFVAARITQEAHAEKVPVLRPSDASVAGERKARRVQAAPGAVQAALARSCAGDEIVIDGKNAWRQARAEATTDNIKLSDSAPGLFEHEGIEAQIEMALEPVVILPSGARLIIEDTRALTAIDIDVAGASRAADVNMQAAGEIPRQILARRLAGNILIDFAQIRRAGELAGTKAQLIASAKKLGLEMEIATGGRTGVLQIQCARAEAPLAAALTNAGVTHSAVPVVPNPQALAAALARAVHRTASRVPGALDVHVSPALAEWLRGDGRALWPAIVSATPAPLNFEVDGALSSGAFEVLPQRNAHA